VEAGAWEQGGGGALQSEEANSEAAAQSEEAEVALRAAKEPRGGQPSTLGRGVRNMAPFRPLFVILLIE